MAWAQAEVWKLLVIFFRIQVPLETYDLPKRCVLVFGQEGPGLSEELHAAARDTLSIRQFGSTRSMNAATTAGVRCMRGFAAMCLARFRRSLAAVWCLKVPDTLCARRTFLLRFIGGLGDFC